MHNTKKFRRYKFLLNAGFVAGMWSLGSGALWFLLPSIVYDVTNDFSMVGLFLAIPGILALFIDVPIGDLADKIGRKKVMIFALTALTLIGLSMNFMTGELPLIVLLVLIGISYPMFFIPMIAYVMDYTPKAKSSEIMGLEFSFIQLGFAIGPVISGVLLTITGFNTPAVLSIVYSTSCLIALIFTVSLLKENTTYHSILEGVREVILKDKIYLKELSNFKKLKEMGLLILVSTLALTIFDGIVWTFQPLYYKTVTDNPLWGGIILSGFILPLILFEVPAGILADRYGRKKLLYLGLFITGGMTWVFSIADTPFLMLASALIASTGIAFSWPSLEGLMTAMSPVSRRGETIGVWGFSRDLGYVIGPILGGFVASRSSMSDVFKFASLILLTFSLLGFISMSSTRGDKKPRKKLYPSLAKKKKEKSKKPKKEKKKKQKKKDDRFKVVPKPGRKNVGKPIEEAHHNLDLDNNHDNPFL